MLTATMSPSRTISLNALDTWIDRAGARIQWETKGPMKGSTIAMYFVNGRTLFIHRYADGGWDIYLPASAKNNVVATLEAADEFCETSGLASPASR